MPNSIQKTARRIRRAVFRWASLWTGFRPANKIGRRRRAVSPELKAVRRLCLPTREGSAMARFVPPGQAPFDFTAAVRNLCVDVTEKLPEFGHIDMSRIAVCFAQTRTRQLH